MDMIKLDYYYGLEAEQFAHYCVPKFLVTNPAYRDISGDAKILYGMLLDRMSLSRKNEWLDEENRVFIIFTVEDVEEQLRCSHAKAVKLLAELDSEKGVGLIERVRRGQGLASIIYVKNFASLELPQTSKQPSTSKKYKNYTSRSIKNRLQEVQKTDFKKSNKRTSGSIENGLPEVQKLDANNTDINNTYMSDTESINTSIVGEGGSMGGSVANDIVENMRREVKAQIEYGILVEEENGGMLDEIVNAMVKVLLSPAKTIKIAGENVNTALVKDAYRRLRASHIEDVIAAYQAVEGRNLNPTNYIRAVLYNAPDSGFLAATNQVSSTHNI